MSPLSDVGSCVLINTSFFAGIKIRQNLSLTVFILFFLSFISTTIVKIAENTVVDLYFPETKTMQKGGIDANKHCC